MSEGNSLNRVVICRTQKSFNCFNQSICDGLLYCICNLRRGRRRSGRLIANPWLYNWPKEPPMYIDLSPSLERPNNLLDDSKGRSKMSKSKKADIADSSDEDDDFVTPGEKFGDSCSIVDKRCSNRKKSMKLTRDSAIIENESNGIVEFGGLLENSMHQ